MRYCFGVVAAAMLLSLAPAPSSASFFSINNMRVAGTAAEFEVFARSGRNTGRQIFCAAGDYAWRALGAQTTDRLVVTRGLSPSGTEPQFESTAFRLVKAGEAPRNTGWNLTLLARRSEGQTRSVGHARILCNHR